MGRAYRPTEAQATPLAMSKNKTSVWQMGLNVSAHVPGHGLHGVTQAPQPQPTLSLGPLAVSLRSPDTPLPLLRPVPPWAASAPCMPACHGVNHTCTYMSCLAMNQL